MKRRSFAFVVMLFCVIALPLTVWADTQTYSPPPKQGVIFIVIAAKGYSSRNVNHSTKVSVKWGSYSRSKSYPSMTRMTPLRGIVIRLRHDKNDSVRLTVTTDGTVQFLEQTSRSPREWQDSNYQSEDW
jgi:hypothetical protein